jgi:hypothetical protein
MVVTDWKFMVQSRLRMPLRIWVKKNRIESYEEAIIALQAAGLPLGTSEEMAEVFPGPANSSSSNTDSSPATTDSRPRRTQEILQRKTKKSKPRSAAEAAADAITESNAVESPKEKAAPKRSRKKKKS